MNSLDGGTFDREKLCLGKLCKRGHDWQGTGRSLRRKSKRECLECERLRARGRDKEERRLRKRAWYEQNRDRTLAVNAAYRETHKEEIKQHQKLWYEENREDRSAYHKDWRERNKEKLIQQRKRDRIANPEKHRLSGAANYIRNREACRKRAKLYRHTDRGRTLEKMARHRKRARLRNASTHAPTFEEIATLRDKCNCQCVYCDSPESLSLDHFIPLCFGGSHCIGNLLIACTSCNSSKHTSDPYEWFQTRPTFSKKRWKSILKLLGKTQETYAQIPLL